MKSLCVALVVGAMLAGRSPETLALHVQKRGARGFQPSVPVTYAKDVAPLLGDRCGMCHHPGGSAPFSLLTYADAKRHATQIVAATASRFMPPWKAEPP